MPIRLRTLATGSDAEAIITRLGALSADDQRRWGTMSPREALCHLSDAFRTGLGEVHPSPIRVMGLRGSIPKWIGLRLPVPWPHGVRGPAEVDPRREGTKPAEFQADRERALGMTRRFIAEVGNEYPHPMFGAMSRGDWLRWGWLHLDHHLRQFGR